MTHEDPDDSVVLKSTPTGFEAETIAMTLRQAGIAAQTVDTATAMTLMGTGIGAARVMVRRGDLERARRIIEEVEHESASIDWDAQDVGEEDPRFAAGAGGVMSKRTAWTIVLLVLVPIGVMAALSGQWRGDSILSGLAMMVMLFGGLLAAWTFFNNGEEGDGDDGAK